MDAIFIKILNLSVMASWIVLAVLLLRLLLRRAPRWVSCAMWAIVALRLALPFSLEAVISLIPSGETIPQNITMTPTPTIESGFDRVDEVVNPIISTTLAPNPGDSANPLQIITAVAAQLWLVGIAVMLIYAVVSYVRLARRVRASICYRDNIYFCDYIDIPFILGVFRPRIYIPSGMSEEALGYVLEHEGAHLRRGDHITKQLGFLLLAVYWFNPIIWLAYILFCRDVEAACDERVIAKLGAESKKDYSEALLSCSSGRRAIITYPLAFGEVGVKSRVKSVLNYQKPAFWIVIAAAIIAIAAAVCLLTIPQKSADELIVTDSYWVCENHNAEFRVNESLSLRGSIKDGNEKTREFVIHWRKARMDAVAELYFFKSDKYNQQTYIEEDNAAIKGIFSAKRGKLHLEIKEDTLGLGFDELIFARADQPSEYYTEYKGVYISLISIEDRNDTINLNVYFHNETDERIILSNEVEIQYKNGGEWQQTKIDDRYHLTNGWVFEPKSRINFGPVPIYKSDISNLGSYRFVLPFFSESGDYYKTWVDFELDQVTPGDGTTVNVPSYYQTVYSHPRYSFIQKASSVPLVLIKGNKLFAFDGETQIPVGDLTTIKLTADNFDNRFPQPDEYNNFTFWAKKLRSENEIAYKVSATDGTKYDDISHIMIQKNGDLLVVYSSRNEFRTMFRLLK